MFVSELSMHPALKLGTLLVSKLGKLLVSMRQYGGLRGLAGWPLWGPVGHTLLYMAAPNVAGGGMLSPSWQLPVSFLTAKTYSM